MSLGKNRTPARGAGRRPHNFRPRLECLEDRVVLSTTVIEPFAPGSLADYTTVLRYRPFAEVSGAATHDGQSGLAKQDGFEWMVRGSQGNPLVQQGQVISVWVQFDDVAAGRAYFGFGARPNAVTTVGSTQTTFLNSGGTLSVVLAPNTNQFLLQANPGFNHPGISAGTPGAATLGAVAQSYQADQWYRVEVEWAVGGAITGRLYGGDGVTLLNTVTGTSTLYTQGGIAFRSFGRPAASPDSPSTDTVFYDTVVVAPLGTSAAELAAAGGGVSPGGVIPANPRGGVQYVSEVGGALVPWLYENTPGTGRDVLLQSYNGPATASILGPLSDPNTLVAFSAANVSRNVGAVPLAWGGPYLGGPFQNGLPQESPVLTQYLFRQRPGEDTELIASADLKHFYLNVGQSSQFLGTNESDPYGTGLNANRNLFLPAATLDPVVGDLLTIDDFGPRNVDGVTTFNANRGPAPGQPYSGGDLLLRARVADIDPAQNPAGTRWFLLGHLYESGDQNIDNNSRWFEVRAQISGSSVTWQTLNNPDAPSAGTLNFRLIPGLREFEGIVPVAPTVASVSPGATAAVAGSIGSVRVTFAGPIDPATFTAEDFTAFTGPNGPIAVTAVNLVAGSNNTQFDVLFDAQTTPGNYTFTFGPDVLNAAGTAMLQAFTGGFTLQGLRVVATTPGDAPVLPGEFSSITLTFNQPIDPATLTADELVTFLGPTGRVAVDAITPVEGSNNTQFRLTFEAQTVTGNYVLVLSQEVANPFGVRLDGSPGLSFFFATFGVQGVRVLSATPASLLPGVTSLRVVFNAAIDPATFTPAQVSAFLGPNGAGAVTGVAAVEGTGNTQFDVFFEPLTAAGAYTLVLGPGLLDPFGNGQDQNNNLTPGEDDDVAVVTFTVDAPRVVGTTLSGQVLLGTGVGRLTFNGPIDPATLTADRIVLTGAGGDRVEVTGVAAVEGTGNTQFDFTFAPLQALGGYTLAVAADVLDPFGNPLTPFAGTFAVRSITASPAPVEDIDLTLQSGTTTVIVSGDDVANPINLGSNTFTFYGQTYTGANQVFVSSNGLITFGSANTAFQNGEWPSGARVPQPAIAVLWSDWIKSAEDAAANGPMVLAKIEGDRLIIQWNRVRNFNGAGDAPSAGAVTFQAILSLNTGTANGDIALNYITLVTQDFNGEGLTSSVGVKPAGNVALTSDNLLTISTNGQAPGGQRDQLVRTGEAVLIRSVARDPRVLSSTLSGTAVALGVGQGRLTFNIPLDPATLTADAIVLTRVGGSRVDITGVTAVAGSNNTQFDFTFAPITAPGSFTLALAAGVTDLTGFPVAPFTGTFTIPATTATSTLTGTVANGVSQGRLTFNRAIDPATLTADAIVLTRVGGSRVDITGVTAVAGSNNTQFDFTFAPLTTAGGYTLALAGVQDTFGNAATFSGTFTVGAQANVVAAAATFQDLDIAGQKGTQTAITSGDDVTASISLGAGNTFTFFGTSYSSLFVSTNGLITFGSANPSEVNNNLTGAAVTQAAIAVLWDDWISSTGNSIVLYRVENGQLIIQWNRANHFSGGGSTVTFQAILDLNTDTTQGDIVFNYVDLDTGAAGTTNGLSATVGVKRAGNLTADDPDRLLVSFNATNTLVGSGRAIRISPRT